MQKLIVIASLALVLVSAVLCDEAADLKIEKEKYTEAKNAVKSVLDKMKSDYIQNFGKTLDKGVDDLEKRTELELQTEKDPTKRAAVIKFATEAYERLIKFAKDMLNEIPSPSPLL